MRYQIETDTAGIIAQFEYEFDRDLCLHVFEEEFPDVVFIAVE